MEEARFEGLGSTCHLLGIGLEPGRLSWGTACVAEMHRRFSRFEPGSEISRFNEQAGRWVDVSTELAQMLRTALDAYRLSSGLVHAGVLGSMLAIGYTRSLAVGPTAAVLTRAASLPPLPELLEVKDRRARLRTGFGIDLGGIAKGWLADILAGQLGENCLVNLGGDLFARGLGPGGEGWPVGLGGVTVLLSNQGAATSGTWRRAWAQGAVRLHHLIDPRTGLPAVSDLSEVSVVASNAVDAEVHAKAALLLGSEKAAAYLDVHAHGWWLAPQSR